MTDTPELNAQAIPEQPLEPTETTPPRPRSLLRRLGCILALALWFFLLLTPCFLIRLATEGELRLRLGDAPDQEARVWLVMEADQRGVGYSMPSVYAGEDTASVCVQTDVRYLLWVGTEAGKPVTYCECHSRPSADDDWTLTSTYDGACAAK